MNLKTAKCGIQSKWACEMADFKDTNFNDLSSCVYILHYLLNFPEIFFKKITNNICIQCFSHSLKINAASVTNTQSVLIYLGLRVFNVHFAVNVVHFISVFIEKCIQLFEMASIVQCQLWNVTSSIAEVLALNLTRYLYTKKSCVLIFCLNYEQGNFKNKVCPKLYCNEIMKSFALWENACVQGVLSLFCNLR